MCTRPKKGFPVGLTPEGKTKYKIVGHDIEAIRVLTDGSLLYFTETDIKLAKKEGAKFNEFNSRERWIFDWIPLPCGQCPECRLNRSREWANRLMMEMHHSWRAYFLTLTYSDEWYRDNHSTFYEDPETGEVFFNMSLHKSDVQLWLKRLRKAFAAEYGNPWPFRADNPGTWHDDRRVRYYLCGEYGKQTLRPHYHVILFCPPLPDHDNMKFYKRTETGNFLYISDWLNRTWSINGMQIGFATVSEVSWEACAYVARYCLKKLHGAEAEFYTVHNLVPEFSLQSTCPGIGAVHYLENPDILDYDFITLPTSDKGLKFAPPRYFRKLREKALGEDPRKAERLQRARERDEHLLDKTTLSYEEYMADLERKVDSRVMQLRRAFEDEK